MTPIEPGQLVVVSYGPGGRGDLWLHVATVSTSIDDHVTLMTGADGSVARPSPSGRWIGDHFEVVAPTREEGSG